MSQPSITLESLWEEAGFKPNAEQERAIRHIDGPLYLTAGPGSGKTRVLLWRTVNLIVFEGVQPEHILLSTFTDKAAHQLREGLKNYLGQVTNHTGQAYDLANMYVGTLHSLCQRLLQDRKLNPNYRNGQPLRVLDELQTYFFVARRRNWQQLIEAAGLADLEPMDQHVAINTFFAGNRAGRSRHEAIQNVLSFFGRMSEEMLVPAAVLGHAPDDDTRMLLRMYARYRELLATPGGFDQCDFSLLQQKAYDVLQANPQVQRYFRHVIVDEYQDTNLIQERLVFALAGQQNLCVVGDDDQALYRFRGATVENFVEFPARCLRYLGREPEKIPLNTNYRSRNRVVQFYTDYIGQHNWRKDDHPGEQYRVHDKNITAHSRDQDVSVVCTAAAAPDVVSEELARVVRELLDSGKVEDPNQIAFLFPALRGNSQVERMQLALEAQGLRVYAPRAGRFLDVEEPTLLFGAFLHVFGRPEQGPFTSADYTGYFDWLNEAMAQVRQRFGQEPELKRYLKAKRQEVELAVSDYQALVATCQAQGWDLEAQYDERAMKPALVGTRAASERTRRAVNSVALTHQVRRRLREGSDKPPLKLADILNRVTTLDWTILDLFYRLSGFPTFKRMYDLAESGRDEGPICNLGLVSQYLSRFMEMYSPLLTAGFLHDNQFQRLFFMSFLYTIYRRGESEFENAEDPFPKGRIPFLTIHQSKGLEFPVVVLPNLRKDNRGAGPLERTVRALAPEAEGEPLDRMAGFDIARMFYVALSRAKNLLLLGRYQSQGNHVNREFKPLLDQLPTTASFDVASLAAMRHGEEKPPKAYSYTADYLLYERCPRQYMVFRRYGLVPSRSQTQFFGSLVHYTIEDLHHRLIEKREKATPQP
ncbi:ATP-dependent helicase [Hymenobacter setariae]|uniref:DNA 3'-5' helicase n=1 Tax=Hymenobacter setariae TaxID=2594794 RepID=A0A558BJQ3_9BACT|nr:ATP-dependent helicase [Hymenobacter setariae]TVT36749.1 ATP-dependent helicase [Hymenobacter setariae]